MLTPCRLTPGRMLGRTARPTRPSMPVSTLPGPMPASGENGEPDCEVSAPLICQPPAACPRNPFCSWKNGTSYTPFQAYRCGRSYVERPRSGRRLNEFCATATSPELEGLNTSEPSSINMLHV